MNVQSVRDVMSNRVEVIPPSCSLKEAAETMRKLDIGSIPVCEGQKLIGIVTDRDVTIKGVASGKDLSELVVKDVMTSPIVYLFDDATIDDAAHIMEEKQIRRLVVVDRDKKLVGVVALGDLAKKINETKAGKILEKISH
jgi:CBS domain-containing protein